MPEYMSDTEGTEVIDAALHYADMLEDKISLSDKFILWLSFYPQSIDN
ncbi:MAG: putative AAA+ superfamily ATPase [Glaciecola sp.]|jgi:predicted AAA+ superfamily ATPase